MWTGSYKVTEAQRKANHQAFRKRKQGRSESNLSFIKKRFEKIKYVPKTQTRAGPQAVYSQRQGVYILKSVAAIKKHFLKFNLSIQNENMTDIDNYTAYELAESNSYDCLYLLQLCCICKAITHTHTRHHVMYLSRCNGQKIQDFHALSEKQFFSDMKLKCSQVLSLFLPY